MLNKLSFGFINYMTQYGLYLGCLVGFFGAIPIAFILLNNPLTISVLAIVSILVIIGTIIGTFYGIVSGFLSGWMMLIVTKFCFRIVRRPQFYKAVMGLVTVSTTSLVFLVLPLWSNRQTTEVLPTTHADARWAGIDFAPQLPDNLGLTLCVMALLFAIYASQQVAIEYLKEVDVRKSKIK